MPLNKDWREFLELFNSNGVEYLVVGAFAVAYHGFPRYTADLDLLVRATGENANRVLRALSEFRFGKLGIQAADLCSPGMVIQLRVSQTDSNSRESLKDKHKEVEEIMDSLGAWKGAQTGCLRRGSLIWPTPRSNLFAHAIFEAAPRDQE